MKNMHIKINNRKHKTYNCFEEIFAAVGSHYDVDITVNFLTAFSFQYCKKKYDDLTLSNPCFLYWGKNEKIVSQYCILNYKFLDREEVKIDEAIEKSINAFKPIGIAMDSFYLPWNKYHLQASMTHMFLIVGIEDENYVCSDPFLNEYNRLLKKEVLHDFCNHIIEFNIQKRFNEPTLQEIISSLKIYLLQNEKTHIDDLNRFAYDISFMKFTSADRIEYKDINKSSFFSRLTFIAWSRINFKSALEYLSEKHETDIFKETINLLSDVSNRWEVVKSLVFKSFIADEALLKKVSSLLHDIAADEAKIIDNIVNL